MMTHTPGPWSASKDKDARGWYGWRIDSNSRTLMAWAAWPSEAERDDIEAEATARLIAAAPDLLATLSRLIDAAVSVYDGQSEDFPGLVEATEAAYRVYEQATGE